MVETLRNYVNYLAEADTPAYLSNNYSPFIPQD